MLLLLMLLHARTIDNVVADVAYSKVLMLLLMLLACTVSVTHSHTTFPDNDKRVKVVRTRPDNDKRVGGVRTQRSIGASGRRSGTDPSTG